MAHVLQILQNVGHPNLKENKINCVSRRSNKLLRAYGSDKPLDVKGIFECEVNAGGRTTQAEFSVIRGKGVPLLGRRTATDLSVLRVGYDLAANIENNF